MQVTDFTNVTSIAPRPFNPQILRDNPFANIEEGVSTVWPALTEAMYLLRGSRMAQRGLWEILERGAVGLLSLTADEVPRMHELMELVS